MLCRSPIWPRTRKLQLRMNMRVLRLQGIDAVQQQEFPDYLLRLGEGREPTRADTDYIRLPSDMCVSASSLEDFAGVYGDMSQHVTNSAALMEHGILAPRNEDAGAVNEKCMQLFPGQVWRAMHRLQRSDFMV